MSVYGEHLAFFPELMEEYNLFTLSQSVSGDYGLREDYMTITGYFTRNKKELAGFPDSTFDMAQDAYLYTYTQLSAGIVSSGVYVEVNNEIYKFVYAEVYSNEGGFSEYRMRRLEGPTDQNTKVDEGGISADF